MRLCAVPALAQQEAAVQGGVQYLRARAGNQQVGESAMIALAMLKAEVPAGDPALAGCLNKVRARFTEQRVTSPSVRNGQGAYEAAPPRWPWPARTPSRIAATSR